MMREMNWMPITPPRKQTIKIQAASFGVNPPSIKDALDDGRMLYSALKSMTPKLSDSDAERNVSLSWILKLRFDGKSRTITSMHMIEAPITHAMIMLVALFVSKITLYFRSTYAAQAGHNPSALVIRETHDGPMSSCPPGKRDLVLSRRDLHRFPILCLLLFVQETGRQIQARGLATSDESRGYKRYGMM